jgi:urease gamma subunit
VFSQDRSKQREFLAKSWQKHINAEILEPLELQLALIVQKHPEYHALINDINLEYFPEQGKTNPFLHINLHLALQDQLTLNRPNGINDIYKKLIEVHRDAHEVEHMMMECIAEMIYQSQKNNTTLDQDNYLISLKNLVQN